MTLFRRSVYYIDQRYLLAEMKQKIIHILRWSEKYTKTDMVYLAHGNFWLTASRIVGVGTGLVLTFIFGNLLKPEVFGSYKYIIAVAGFIGSFTLGGLGGALGRTGAQGKRNLFPGVFKESFKWSIP